MIRPIQALDVARDFFMFAGRHKSLFCLYASEVKAFHNLSPLMKSAAPTLVKWGSFLIPSSRRDLCPKRQSERRRRFDDGLSPEFVLAFSASRRRSILK